MSDDEESVTNYAWDGQLPSAVGKIAKEFAKVPLDVQRTDASDVYEFLTTAHPDLSRRNADTSLVPLMLSCPDSNKIKVVYTIGSGMSGFWKSPMDSKMLVLMGDVDEEERQTPAVVVLPANILKQVKVPTLSHNLLRETMQAQGMIRSGKWFKGKDLAKESVSMCT